MVCSSLVILFESEGNISIILLDFSGLSEGYFGLGDSAYTDRVETDKLAVCIAVTEVAQ